MKTPTDGTRVFAYDAKRLFSNFTGLGNYSRTLLKNLAETYPQHEYHLFTPRVIKNEETAFFLEDTRFTVHTPKAPNPFWRSFTMSAEVNALKPSLFHGLSHEIPFGLDQSILSVVTFHDLIYALYPRQFGLWDRWMYRWKYRSSAQRADAIVAISRSTAEDLRRLYKLPVEKIHIVMQSARELFQADSVPIRKNLAVSLPEEPYFLYVGSIIPRKGLDRLVAAFARLSGEFRRPVVVVGNGSGAYMASIHEALNRLKLEKYFTFISFLTNEDLCEVYDRCLALVYPSMYEGFGIPVIEALFRSRPVITSNTSSLPEAAGPGAILTDPKDILQLRDAMIDIQETSTRSRLAEAGNAYVRREFSSENTARSMMQLYEQLLQNFQDQQ